MRDFGIAIEIDAPPDRVWAVIRDGPRWPEWTPTVTSIKPLDAGPLAVGQRFVIRQPKLPPAKWQLTELDDPARRFTWVTRGPGMVLYARHSVEDLGGRSRAHLALEFAGLLGPLFARLTAKLNGRYLALEANGLKQFCERARAEGQ